MKNTNNSVKKHQSYWVLLIALLICGSVSAKVNHYVGGYAQAAEWSLIPSKSDYSGSLGVAGGLGFQYELQYSRNYSPWRLLFDAGVGATGGLTAYLQTSSKVVPLKNQTDLNGWLFNYVYDIRDRKDSYTNIAVHVPLMLGVQYKRIYALAGIKVYANIFTQTRTKAVVSTYGEYTQIDNLYHLPDVQFFEDVNLDNSVKTSLNLDLDFSMEVGARLGTINYAVGYDVPKRTLEYRIAGFFDIGLVDVHTKGTVQALGVPERYDVNPKSPNYVYKTRTMLDNMALNDVMSTNGFASMVRNMMVGVKFTVLFQLPEPGKCVLCRDAYKSSVRTYTGSSRGMKYEE